MPGISSLELHTPLRERGVDIPIILLTDLRLIAVTATRKGAVDSIEKPSTKSRWSVGFARPSPATTSRPVIRRIRPRPFAW
jgi:FixJ family two-component response regulator